MRPKQWSPESIIDGPCAVGEGLKHVCIWREGTSKEVVTTVRTADRRARRLT